MFITDSAGNWWVSNCAANGFTEMEICRESKRGTCIGHIIRYCYPIMFGYIKPDSSNEPDMARFLLQLI